SFWLLTQVDPGFDSKGLLSLQIALPDATYPDDHQVTAFYDRLVDRLEQLPGVEGAAAVSGLPPNRQVNANDTEFEGVPEPPNGPIHNVDYWQFVSRGYFDTMGIPVLQGRAFNESDAKGTPGVVVVNQTLANLFWPGQSPLGKRVKAPAGRNTETPWLTVVGVVKDVKQGGLDKKTGTEMYFLTDQSPDTIGFAPDTMYLMLRTPGDPLQLVAPVRDEVRRMDPALPLADVRPMTDVIFASVAQPRFVAFMVLVFAIVALALAAIGTYGVLAYTVEQRTQEIGVRMALGAQARQVLGMILAQGAWLVSLGLLLGVGGAIALRRVLASVLFGVTPTDPAILGAVVLVLSAVAFAACYLPARRATQVDPLVALRNE
ncbi:MAG TPA: ABC transporter permease, partial [Thermoanaerobaculia bacterium]